MQLFCPACQSAFTGVSRCPRCNGLLLMPEEAAFLPTGPDPGPPRPEKPTAAGRLAVGVVVGLGAYLGLRQLLAGWATARTDDPANWWRTEDGLAAVFAARAAAAGLGALLAGAGRPRGGWLGAGVGLTCGGLYAGVEFAGGVFDILALAVLPAALAAAGAAAGAAAAWVWAGVPDLDMPAPATARRSSSIQLDTVAPKDPGRPTAWVRVLLGAAVVAAGVAGADPFRRAAEKHTQGAVRAASIGQARFLSSQLAVLAVLVGAGLAAAGTGAGIRHGVLAGVLGAAGVAGLALAQGVLPIPAGYLAEHMNLDPLAGPTPAALAAVAFGLGVTGVVGGWLGGTLFLPLAPAHLRGRNARLGMD